MGTSIKFTGLSSGLDTASVVEALLTPYQSKIDIAKSNKIKAEWKKDIYSDLSKKLNGLKQSANKLKVATSSASMKATLSNSNALSVKTDGKYTGDSEHSIQVKQLASKANVPTRTIKDSKGNKVTSETSIADLVKPEARNTTVKIGKAEVKLSESTTIKDIVEQVKSGDSSIDIRFDDNAGAFIINSANTGAAETISITDEFGNEITKDNSAYDVFTALGIGASSSSGQDAKIQMSYEGTDAEVLYNGSLTVTSDKNDFTINGLTFTANEVTDQPVKVNITKDITKLTDTVKSFIEEYNSILKEITTRVNAEPATKYKVLTDEEKEAMTDKEVEMWEDKIKGSLLRNDSSLKNLYQSFRSVMSDNYSKATGNNAFGLLSQIGISSSSWTDQGQLTIDEDKLQSAMSEDPDAVLKLINNVASELEQVLIKNSTTNESRSYGQYFNDKAIKLQITSFTNAIDKAQDRYDRQETYYYKKFTSMETAMNKMNSTTALFAQL